jgi:hypothetical protein
VGEEPSAVAVRVPTIGAFVLQKAASYAARPDSAKAGKDIVYLRDIMRGGTLVMSQVKQDIAAVLRDGGTQRTVSEARGAVREILRQRPAAVFAAAVREVSERERITDAEAATADLMAHLAVLARLLGAGRPPRRSRS